MMHTASTTVPQAPARLPEDLPPQRVSKTEGMLDYAALGCLIAGALAIIKALEMKQAVDALICLPASVAACSLVCYLYFRKD